jgi:hypothetical protein
MPTTHNVNCDAGGKIQDTILMANPGDTIMVTGVCADYPLTVISMPKINIPSALVPAGRITALFWPSNVIPTTSAGITTQVARGMQLAGRV